MFFKVKKIMEGPSVLQMHRPTEWELGRQNKIRWTYCYKNVTVIKECFDW